MSNYQLGQRFWGMQIKRTLLSFAVVFAIGLISDRLLFDEYARSGVWAGVFAVAFYILAGLALAVVSAISGFAYLLVWRGTDMETAVLADLRSNSMPPPDDYHPKRFSYLEQIAGDDDYPPDVRVRAAALFTAYTVISNRAGFFRGAALATAADEAVLRYAQEAPRYRRISEVEGN